MFGRKYEGGVVDLVPETIVTVEKEQVFKVLLNIGNSEMIDQEFVHKFTVVKRGPYTSPDFLSNEDVAERIASQGFKYTDSAGYACFIKPQAIKQVSVTGTKEQE